MPLPANIIRCVLRGSLLGAVGGAPVDQFAHQVTIQVQDPLPVFNWEQATVEAAGNLASAFIDAWDAAPITARFPPTVRYDEVRAYRVDPAGQSLNVANAPLLLGPGTGDVSLPTECSVAVGLYSYGEGEFNIAGRRGRGRFYLPPVSRAQVDVGGVLSASAQGALATWCQEWLQAFVNGTVGDPETPVDLVIPGSDGVARVVERLAVGRVVDAQRRRRSEFDEVYTSRAIENV